MKRNTPLITLLGGAALGVILLIASMASTPQPPSASPGGGGGSATTAPGGGTTSPSDAALAIPGCVPTAASATGLSSVQRSAVRLGGRPFAVKVTPDRRYSFVTLGDSVAVLSNAAGSAPKLLHTLPVPGARKGEAITSDGRYLLAAAGSGAAVISVTSAVQGSAAVLGTLSSPGGSGAVQVALSPDDQFAFVTLQGSGGVAVFNLRHALAGGFASSFVGLIPTGRQPVGLAVSADPAHKWLYVTSWGPPGTISVVDRQLAQTDPRKAVVTKHPRPAGCLPSRVMTSADGSTVWVTAQGSNALLAFSAAKLRTDPDHSLTALVRVGKKPIGEAFISHNRQIVIANSDSSPPTLTVVDTRQALCGAGQRALVGSIPAGTAPRELDPGIGRTLLATNLAAGQLEAVSTSGIPASQGQAGCGN